MRRIDSCITQLKAHGPSRTCNESKEEEVKKKVAPRTLPVTLVSKEPSSSSQAPPGADEARSHPLNDEADGCRANEVEGCRANEGIPPLSKDGRRCSPTGRGEGASPTSPGAKEGRRCSPPTRVLIGQGERSVGERESWRNGGGDPALGKAARAFGEREPCRSDDGVDAPPSWSSLFTDPIPPGRFTTGQGCRRAWPSGGDQGCRRA